MNFIVTSPPNIEAHVNSSSWRRRRRSKKGKAMRARVYGFVCRYKETHDGNSPSLRDIVTELGLSSTSVANYHLMRLENDGRIEIVHGSTRQINVIGGKWTHKEDKNATF